MVLNRKLVILCVLVFLFLGCFLITNSERKIDFSTDVKPILNGKCISCHGGVKAKGGFSVLFREEALAKTESGRPAIIPGNPKESEMIRRLTLDDASERMPYKHERLSDEEIRILTLWVEQGAEWGNHWAYMPIEETKVPESGGSWVRNGVDKFILQKMDEQNLRPSAQADKATLLRRVSLDLIGMYPSEEVIRTFLDNNDQAAYEKLVDTLLNSLHFGEKWASMWLDLARYADTKGYDQDLHRNIWQYRDWVIRAFNEDKPYDQFLTEQIAGDLFPDPTDADYIATAFSRNTMSNDEGGTDNEEFRIAAVLDRVNTTWEALMGTTFACVQCHSHPYDPFRHEEYYKFLAYFNNTRDEDTYTEYPLLRAFDDSLRKQVDQLTSWVKERSSEERARRVKNFLRTGQPAVYAASLNCVKNSVIENNNQDLLVQNNGVFLLKQLTIDGLNHLVLRYATKEPGGVINIHLDSSTGEVLAKFALPQTKEWSNVYIPFSRQTGVRDLYFTYYNSRLPADGDHFYARFDWLSFVEFPDRSTAGYAKNMESFKRLFEADVHTVPVMVENPFFMIRETNVFERGNPRSPGKKVAAGVPASLQMAMPGDAPGNRIGLAAWLTSKKNPLVSRTLVNRLWEQLFGAGIVETLEDMGTQGVPPTHRELLDHYSYRFMHDMRWSIKTLLKEFVMSATYMQDSRLTDASKEKDLFNKYYARGPRVRLSAEQLRDQHLCISGVLNEKMYGPSVMPWQPQGVWNSPYNNARWENSEGEERFRRAVYTYWKRSSPYPSMINFDAGQRVVCVARRIRTNTPLQALVTLNDSAFVEMARYFAQRMKKDGGGDIGKQISEGYKRMLFREIPPESLLALEELFRESLKELQKDDQAVAEITGKQPAFNDATDAALVMVANAMLNLDEIVMRN